jgi:CheY-like chemotaxis protein
MRILVIDDEPHIRSLLRRLLEPAGHKVSEACNGKEGLRLFELESPDLVIIDMIMPEMDGAETILNLRSGETEPRIIAMSGGTPRLSPHTCLQVGEFSGCAATLIKPFDKKQLLEALNRVVFCS